MTTVVNLKKFPETDQLASIRQAMGRVIRSEEKNVDVTSIFMA